MSLNKKLLKSFNNYLESISADFDSIPAARKANLEKISEYTSTKILKDDTAKLVFICTHNSRRSHIAQLWAQAAAHYYNIPGIICYSGGTEATAFYPAAVNAMRRAGFDIEQIDATSNPVYLVKYSTVKDPVKAFSKIYDDPFNPQQGFAAIMVCSDADENCPLVHGAGARFSIPYEDPKVSDNTADEELRYDERCKQIATEMFYMISKIS